VSLKYQDLYYKYNQKVDILKALKQSETAKKSEDAPEHEEKVVASFFSFLASRCGGGQVVLLANSTQLFPRLRQKASPQDIHMIAGQIFIFFLYYARRGAGPIPRQNVGS